MPKLKVGGLDMDDAHPIAWPNLEVIFVTPPPPPHIQTYKIQFKNTIITGVPQGIP